MRFAAAAAAVLAAALLAGCAGHQKRPGKYEETVGKLSKEVSQMPPSEEKKRSEELLAKLQGQLVEARKTNERDEAELVKLKAFAAAAGAVKLELGFATSGKDWTGDGAVDGVAVYIVPRDATGSAVKCPGSAEVTLSEESAIGSGREIDRWVISTDSLRNAWNESLFPAYVAQLPWHEEAPKTKRGVLAVKFTPVYGQALSGRKTIDIATP